MRRSYTATRPAAGRLRIGQARWLQQRTGKPRAWVERTTRDVVRLPLCTRSQTQVKTRSPRTGEGPEPWFRNPAPHHLEGQRPVPELAPVAGSVAPVPVVPVPVVPVPVVPGMPVPVPGTRYVPVGFVVVDPGAR